MTGAITASIPERFFCWALPFPVKLSVAAWKNELFEMMISVVGRQDRSRKYDCRSLPSRSTAVEKGMNV
jgi:hypothetical protein